MRRKKKPETRVKDLVRCATAVFCEKGYRQTQMADIAKAMGVAPGTLYLYVEGKEALFGLVVRHGVESGTTKLPQSFPIANPRSGETLEYVRNVLRKGAKWPKLNAALRTSRARDPRLELSGIVQELYSLIARNRWGLILLSRSAMEFPGLAELFFDQLRKPLLSNLATYIRSRMNAGQFASFGDPRVTAVFLNESVAWAAMNRMCDPEFRMIRDEDLSPIVSNALVHAFTSPSTKKRKKT